MILVARGFVLTLNAMRILAKDHELRQAVQDYKSQLDKVTVSLEEFKHRALSAEVHFSCKDSR